MLTDANNVSGATSDSAPERNESAEELYALAERAFMRRDYVTAEKAFPHCRGANLVTGRRER